MQKIAKEIEESREKNVTKVSVKMTNCIDILILPVSLGSGSNGEIAKEYRG